MLKKLLIAGLVLIAAAFGVGYYLWNKPHENMQSAEAAASVEAAALYQAFTTDEAKANTDYLGKTIQVSGTVTTVTLSIGDPKSFKVNLDTGDPLGAVVCELDKLSEHPRTQFNNGEKVTFKGKCTGYLSDVILDRCVEVR